jgi:tRNA A37 threonylcarbamoyladenosine modification protein TsaB
MILCIDTSDNQKIIVKFGKRQIIKKIRIGETQKLLNLVNKLIKEEKVSLRQLTEIKVNPGPGSFTGLRVGVAVANALGWALAIPVNGRKIIKGKVIVPEYQ